MTEKETYLARIERMKVEDGLISHSFTLGPDAANATEDEIYAELNRIQDAIDRGECADVDFAEVDRRHLRQTDIRSLLTE